MDPRWTKDLDWSTLTFSRISSRWSLSFGIRAIFKLTCVGTESNRNLKTWLFLGEYSICVIHIGSFKIFDALSTGSTDETPPIVIFKF